MRHPIAMTLILAAGLAASPALADDCAHKAEREAALDAGGARSVRIEAGAGELRIEGRTGQTRVEARGTACASSENVLGQIHLNATRQGDVIVVKVEIPEGSSWGWNEQARLDLTVTVPRIMPLDVDDGSGSAEIAHVGKLTVRDGSGELSVSDVTGDLGIVDGSGSIEVAGVTGNVRLSDGSGSITVRDVGGSVMVEEDGSGSIEVQTVTGSVTVERDGSGSIDVAGVKGDFTVSHDGSGGIAHRDVAGQVRIPSDRHDH
jgi:DUF4097 and DUF4098 domain-containing protein YvlB